MAIANRGGQQAYPMPIAGSPGDWTLGPGGMTIREAFATAALHGVLACNIEVALLAALAEGEP